MHHAEQEGVEFHWLTNPVEILDDASRQRARDALRAAWSSASPTPPVVGARSAVAGSEFEFETDLVVFAIGTNANPIIGQTSGLKLNKRGYIETDDEARDSMAGVFAGGDIVTGAATVIEAMGAGRKAARSMKPYLGLRDTGASTARSTRATLFGIDRAEHNFARVQRA